MSKTPSQTRILVTGGSGFLGSSLVARLNALGYDQITIVDRLGKTDKWRNLVGLRYAHYMEVDAFRTWRVVHPCEFDVVFALGACSSTRVEDASYLMENNLADLIELYRWAIAYKWSPDTYPRFIYASSSATYGHEPADDSRAPHTLRPLNPYGLSKNMFDQYAERAGWLDRIVGLKYSNVFGPGCEHKGNLISFPTKVFREVRAQGFTSMYDTYLSASGGPERDSRDFLYVKDAVEMTIHFAFGAGAKATGLFNVGAGVSTTWKEVAELTIEAYAKATGDTFHILNADGSNGAIRYTPMPAELRGRYQYYTCSDITKLRATGYDKPVTPIKEAIQEYVREYLVSDLRVGERTIALTQASSRGAPSL